MEVHKQMVLKKGVTLTVGSVVSVDVPRHPLQVSTTVSTTDTNGNLFNGVFLGSVPVHDTNSSQSIVPRGKKAPTGLPPRAV